MADRSREIADSMVETLNANTFSDSFTAERKYAPRFTKEDFVDQGPKVVVVPESYERQKVARGGAHQTEYAIDVMVMKHLEDGQDGEEVADLADEIERFLEDRVVGEVTPLTHVIQTAIEVLTLASEQHIAHGIFTRAVRVTYTEIA